MVEGTPTWCHYYMVTNEQAILRTILPAIKIDKLKKAIANFEQQPGESLYEAWEHYKGLLRNCPQNDLNVQ